MTSPKSFLGTPATAPGPDGPTMLRGFGVIRRNPLRALAATWRHYGDVVQYPIPRPPTYLVNDPDGVRRVLVGNARNYGKSTVQYRALSLVTGEGLLVADTEPWRRQRRLVQPAFHHETLEGVVDHVNTALAGVCAAWDRLPEGSVTDVDAAMMHAALEVVGHALFGTDLSSDAERLASATLEALDVVVARARVPITPPAWVPTPANRRLQGAVAQLDSAVAAMLSQPPRGHDMLAMLRSVTDDTGAGLTAQEIRDQIVTFIVAGHETVASAMTWAWALVAGNPEVQDRLCAEAESVLGDRAVAFADLALLRQIDRRRCPFFATQHFFQPDRLAQMPFGVADQHDHVAGLFEGKAGKTGHIRQHTDSADGRRGQNTAAIGFVIQRHIARHDRKIERQTGLADPLQATDKLAHRIGPFGIAEIEIVGNRQRLAADSGDIAPCFGHRLLAALERIGLAIARRHV